MARAFCAGDRWSRMRRRVGRRPKMCSHDPAFVEQERLFHRAPAIHSRAVMPGLAPPPAHRRHTRITEQPVSLASHRAESALAARTRCIADRTCRFPAKQRRNAAPRWHPALRAIVARWSHDARQGGCSSVLTASKDCWTGAGSPMHRHHGANRPPSRSSLERWTGVGIGSRRSLEHAPQRCQGPSGLRHLII